MFRIYISRIGLVYDDTNPYMKNIREPKLTMEAGLAGSLEFVINCHSDIGDLSLINTYVAVTRTLDQTESTLWVGRVYSQDLTEMRDRNIVCEGILASLNDTLQIPSNVTGIGHLMHFLNIVRYHNSKVSSSDPRYFDLTDIDQSSYPWHIDLDMMPDVDADPVVYNYSRERKSTFDTIREQFLNPWGGHLFVRSDFSKADSDWNFSVSNHLEYIDGYDTTRVIHDQPIEFGKNLVSIKRSVYSDDFATAFIPTGASLSDFDKTWIYYRSSANWKIEKFAYSPDSPEYLDYYGGYSASRGYYIDADSGNILQTSNGYYLVCPEILVRPGEVFYLTTYLEGLSTDSGVASYVILTTDRTKVVSIGPSVRNNKDENGNIVTGTLELTDEQITIPENGGVLIVARRASSTVTTGLLLRKFNEKYMETDATIMSAPIVTNETITKPYRYWFGRDVYPDATANATAPEVYDKARVIYYDDLVRDFGVIEKTISFSDIPANRPEVLFYYSKKALEKMVNKVELEVQAVDMSYVDSRYSPFNLLDMVHIYSPPHGVDVYLPILKIELPLDDPSRAIYTAKNEVDTRDGEPIYMSTYINKVYEKV